MPTVLFATDIAEEALREIGAYTTNMEQADAQQMKVALRRLELVLNTAIGVNVYLPSWREYDIPLIAGQSEYLLSEFVDDNGIQFITDTKVFDTTINRHYDFELVTEQKFQVYDGEITARPYRGFVDKTSSPTLHVYPLVDPSIPNGQYTLHIVAQVYANAIDPNNSQNVELILRPTWYLWAIKKLAFALGCGPIFRLPMDELEGLGTEVTALETALLASDGKHNTSDPPITAGHDPGLHYGRGWGDYNLNRPDYHSVR